MLLVPRLRLPGLVLDGTLGLPGSGGGTLGKSIHLLVSVSLSVTGVHRAHLVGGCEHGIIHCMPGM